MVKHSGIRVRTARTAMLPIPDLRLHMFGVKLTALKSAIIRENIWSADSMVWSFAAKWQGRKPNDWRKAQAFVERVESWR